MVVIDAYRFGAITIAGRTYTSDVLIFPDGRVRDGWWRASGHRLTLADLDELLAAGPNRLVVGTGASGLMRPESGLAEALARRGVEVEFFASSEAVRRFNELAAAGQRPAACFHLTC